MSGDMLARAELPGIFGDFYAPGDRNRFLVVCRSRSRKKYEEFLPGNSSCSWFFNIRSADEIEIEERSDLGIVLNQIEHMRRPDAMHLLSRMRDQFCQRVLVSMNRDIFTDQELLALGYIRKERPSSDGRYYLFDPDIFFESRDWNTPEHWAHPDNFTRNRW